MKTREIRSRVGVDFLLRSENLIQWWKPSCMEQNLVMIIPPKKTKCTSPATDEMQVAQFYFRNQIPWNPPGTHPIPYMRLHMAQDEVSIVWGTDKFAHASDSLIKHATWCPWSCTRSSNLLGTIYRDQHHFRHHNVAHSQPRQVGGQTQSQAERINPRLC
jgi:hypothetical protein